jgi:hypothetical protein
MTDAECDALLGELFGNEVGEQTDVHPKAAEIKKHVRKAVREAVAA